MRRALWSRWRHFYSRASARRDCSRLRRPACCGRFLLTRLCEARQKRIVQISIGLQFLLTRLCEARRKSSGRGWADRWVSTHAPLRGATITCVDSGGHFTHFYSRASARRDRIAEVNRRCNRNFYSRASARRDSTSDSDVSPAASFLLTRLCEARPVPTGPSARSPTFLLTRLCEARRPSTSCASAASAFLLTRLCEARRRRNILFIHF